MGSLQGRAGCGIRASIRDLEQLNRTPRTECRYTSHDKEATIRHRGYAVIEAPSNLGLRPPRPGVEPGVRRLPDAFEAVGFTERLAAVRVGRVEPPPYTGAIDPGTGIREAPAIREYSGRLAAAVDGVLDDGRFPVVLGGDCSILLGNLLALRRRGRYGLFFLDGHPDFAGPDTSATKAAAGMDLALATGHGPDLLARLYPDGPLVLEEDVAVFGVRGVDPEGRRRLSTTKLSIHELDYFREGMADRTREELERLTRKGVDGFWIHVDADVLDDAVMPAVDSRQPGGLTLDELGSTLRRLLESPLAVGMHVTIYDPDLDPSGAVGRGLTDTIVAALMPRG